MIPPIEQRESGTTGSVRRWAATAAIFAGSRGHHGWASNVRLRVAGSRTHARGGTAPVRRRTAASWVGVPAQDSRGTLDLVAVPDAADPGPVPEAPGRILLRFAGVFSQLTCAACLLLGTIGLVLVQQNKAGSVGSVTVWLVMAMAGLVVGGLVYRGNPISILAAAAIDAAFGVALVTFDGATLRALLAILPSPDVVTIGKAMGVLGCAMLGATALCLVSVPQGIRYARWLRDAAATRNAMSTARGFPPPPVPARGSVYMASAQPQPASRRKLYLLLGGLAIGVGTAVGVVVSSTESPVPSAGLQPDRPAAGTPAGAAPVASAPTVTPIDPASAPVASASAEPAGATPEVAAIPSAPAAPEVAAIPGPPVAPVALRDTIRSLVAAEHAAIAAADAKAFAALVIPNGFAIGVSADEVVQGREAVAAQLARALGEPPAGGFTVVSRAFAIGQERNHAWIAQDLELSAADRPSRRLAITELAALIDGQWQLVALHWATPIDDATAERLAAQRALPSPQPIADRKAGPVELDRAVRAAFASRQAFAAAVSSRSDAFNLGSGGERLPGGAAIKRVFARLKAKIRMQAGATVVDGSAWDPAQRSAPWIAWAALNADFTSASRAAAPPDLPFPPEEPAPGAAGAAGAAPAPPALARRTVEVTQAFRVLAIAIKEGSDWKIVQTQWSNGGPFAD